MSRTSVALLAGALAFLVLPSSGTAQAPRRPPPPDTPQRAAIRALHEGRFDEVDAIADKMDQRDGSAAALKARAAIARGRYEAAEALLRPAASRAPHGDAALELGLLRHMLGGADATPILEKVASLADTSDDPREVLRAARALRALERFREANAAFREAAGGLPTDPAAQTEWGELFLEKYDHPEALRSFQMALQIDPRWTPALVGAARALSDDNPPQAAAFAKKALEVNPSSVDAHLFLASEAADASYFDEARRSIGKALAVNAQDADALALRAALSFVQDKPEDFEADVAKASAIAPRDPSVFLAASELAARNYRFEEAVALTRRALLVAPDNPRALGDLGIQLLRVGDEPAAYRALDASFKGDGYNKLVLNLLTMMDALDKFVTVKDGDLIVRMHKDDAPVLQEYAVPLAHQALSTMAARYDFTPKGPILIEIFPKHDDFAVRTFGLPGMIGALGVCFGRVVAMDSPRARPPGEFQWEGTLWHELGHVITLQMSNQRVPRWLTEGISEFEEQRARPEWRRDMDIMFAGLMNRGEAIKLVDLNASFQDPKLIALAYYEGSLVVEHIVSAYGQPALNKLVRSFAQGLDTDAGLKSALNTDFASMQAGFDQMLEQKFGAVRKALAMPEGVEELGRTPSAALKTLADANPRSFPIQMALGRALRKEAQPDAAMQAFERAAALVPSASGKDSPHDQMAAIALEKKDTARAIAELTALVAVDFNNVEAARQLATLLRQGGAEDAARLQPVAQRIAAIDPFDPDAHSMLGRFALQRNDAEAAAREFRAVIALGPVDRAAAYTDLAESYFKAGKRSEAKKQTIAALEIAPNYERAQDLLLKIVAGGQQR
jgi:tetratricopeptide (TPR) repeat protein